jgi:hypothetical protein
VQRDWDLRTVRALDVRNQCSGFIYTLSVADQYIKKECIKRFGRGSESTFNRVRYDITWSWCIGNILEMEQEQRFE